MHKIDCDRALVGRRRRVSTWYVCDRVQFLVRDRTSFWYAITPLVCYAIAYHPYWNVVLLVRDEFGT